MDGRGPEDQVGFRSTRVPSSSAGRENFPADFLVVIQIGPTGGELYYHATRGFDDAGADLDQACAPGTRLALAQGIVLAALVVPLPATTAGERFGWDLAVCWF